VARLIEAGARDAGDAERLSLDVERAEERLREAAWQARRRVEGAGAELVDPEAAPAADGEGAAAGGLVICAADVIAAIEARERRFGRIRERSQEVLLREHVEVATEGAVVGQVNGLAVLQLGPSAFGKPSRISARVGLGKGEVVDIEREAQLGGPLHTKGVLILSGFLAGRFGAERPLSLAASLVFEQSYGGVDGDSASSAELYALLSALAEVPLDQGRAVTGAVGQRGEVLAIGGVNHKIEGFFDLCAARGLTGEQGVLIPQANRDHLMLRPDVVEAVSEGRFHVWPVRHVDQGIELLTGVAAGRREDGGDWPPESVNGRVAARLAVFLERQVALARQQRGVTAEPDDGAEPAAGPPVTGTDAAHGTSAVAGARS
jgi:predicted ATP-dependent protease